MHGIKVDIFQFECAFLKHVVIEDVLHKALYQRELAQNHLKHPECLIHAFVAIKDALESFDEVLKKADAHFDWRSELVTHSRFEAFCVSSLLVYLVVLDSVNLLVCLLSDIVNEERDNFLPKPCALLHLYAAEDPLIVISH